MSILDAIGSWFRRPAYAAPRGVFPAPNNADARFAACIPLVLQHEGGYVWDRRAEHQCVRPLESWSERPF